MARPSLSSEEKRAIRNKIRAAASKLYKTEGPTKLTARSVAAEAGVSVGTIYAYFGSLRDVMQSLWREPVRKLITDLEELTSQIDNPKARLSALLQAYVDFAEANPSVFRNSFLFVRPEAAEPPPQVTLERDRFFQLYRNALREGQSAGVFREGSLDELTQMLLSAIHGSLSLPINLHRLALDDSNRVPNLMVDALLEWLVSPEQN